MTLSHIFMATQPGIALAITDLVTQCRHIVAYIDQHTCGLDFSIVVGQTSLVQQPESFAIQFQKYFDGHAMPRPVVSLIDMSLPLQLFGLIRHNDAHSIIWPWTERYQTALQQCSQAEKLQFDQYSRPLPNIFAKQLYIGMQSELLWHDTESFADWFLKRWKE